MVRARSTWAGNGVNDDVSDVALIGLPADTFEHGITYLADVLRECQLILVDGAGGAIASRLDVVALAKVLVPDLEEVRDLFRHADLTATGDRVDVIITLRPSAAATLVHLQMHLVQLRFVEVEGGVLVSSDPEVIDLLRWIWDEVSEQLRGRLPRPHPAT